MRKTVIANDLSSSLKQLLIVFGTTKYTEDHSSVPAWEHDLKERDPKSFELYQKAMSDGVINWEKSTRDIPGSYSVNAYRAGRRGKDARQSETCLRLAPTTPKERQLIKSSRHSKCRYLWKNYSVVFSPWERQFIKSIGELLAKSKPLSVKQSENIEKLFKKYKIPDDAVASSAIA
jgi:hypothetical protein